MNFELSSQEGMNAPKMISLRFQQGERQYLQNLTNDTFCRLHVTSVQSNIGTGRTFMLAYHSIMMMMVNVHRVIAKLKKHLEL